VDTGWKVLVRRIAAVTAVSLVLSVGVGASTAQARVTVVSSLAALQTAIDSAAAGDVIQLANGTYRDGSIRIGTSGITVEAQTTGGVTLTGSQSVTVAGDDTVLRGFRFASGSIPGNVITVSGSRNTLTELSFDGYSAQKYVVLSSGSQRNAVTWSNFANKPTSAPRGNLVHIDPDPTVPGYHVISRNTFQRLPGTGGDFGNEPIRIGNGAQSTYVSRTTVEHNYFEDTGAGDSEAVSVKSRENVLRWNTMRNNPNAMFVFRNGDDNVAYGNFFLRSGGIRIVEASDIWIYGNHFEYAGVGGTMAALTYDAVSPNLTNVNVIHNTFYEPSVIALGSGGTTNVWADNLLVKASGALFSGTPNGIRWTGNLHRGTLGITPTAGGSTAISDPGLVAGPQGFQQLVAGSPAIDRAAVDYPSIRDVDGLDDDPTLAFDVQGQARPVDRALKDVGADEYQTTAALRGPLVLTDVGPSYLRAGAWVFPTQVSAGTVGSGDNNGFETGASNLFALDGALARDANSGTGSSMVCSSTVRDRADLSGFPIVVPVGSTIRGIEVQIRGRVSSKSSTPRFCIRLSADGGATWSVGRTTTDLSTTLTTRTLGSASDLWGRAWSASDLGPGFRVQVTNLSTSTARTFEVDAVSVRVTT
jgi:poly(beta-D-mannuronate) lyase